MKFKILNQTPKLLKLQLQPKGIFYWLFGGIFIAGGVLLMTTMGKTTTFTCSRLESTQANCQLITKTIFKSQVQSWNLKQLLVAKLDTSTTDAWNSYPLVILTSNGSVRINLVNADSTQKESKAAQINTFLQNPVESKLTIHEDSRLWSYPLGLFLIASGIICIIYILMNNKIICIFDKTLNKAIIERESWFGKKVVETKLSEIVGINVVGLNIDPVIIQSSTSYNIVLKLASEKEIYLAAGSMFTPKIAKQTIEAIASFLQLNSHVINHTTST